MCLLLICRLTVLLIWKPNFISHTLRLVKIWRSQPPQLTWRRVSITGVVALRRLATPISCPDVEQQ
jgi:hypothetical protein